MNEVPTTDQPTPNLSSEKQEVIQGGGEGGSKIDFGKFPTLVHMIKAAVDSHAKSSAFNNKGKELNNKLKM